MKIHNLCAVPNGISEEKRHLPERKKIYAMTSGFMHSGVINLSEYIIIKLNNKKSPLLKNGQKSIQTFLHRRYINDQ